VSDLFCKIVFGLFEKNVVEKSFNGTAVDKNQIQKNTELIVLRTFSTINGDSLLHSIHITVE